MKRCSIFLGTFFLVFVFGCGNSTDFQDQVFSSSGETREVTFQLDLAQAQTTGQIPGSFTEFEVVSSGPDRGRGAPVKGDLTKDITVSVPADTTSCDLFLSENGTRRLQGFFVLPPGSGDVLFEQPRFGPFFGGQAATGLNFRLFAQPLLKDEPVKVVVETDTGVDVTKDGEFEVDPPGAVTIDENGVVTGLQVGTGVTLSFRLRKLIFDLAVGTETGPPLVSLFDSSQMEKGPINQFLAFGPEVDGVQVAAGDFNGDGEDEVCCLGDDTFRIFKSDGQMLADLQIPVTVIAPEDLDNLIVAAGDIGGDGTDEIAVYSPNKEAAILLNFQGNTLSIGDEVGVPTLTSIIGFDVCEKGLMAGSAESLVTVDPTSGEVTDSQDVKDTIAVGCFSKDGVEFPDSRVSALGSSGLTSNQGSTDVVIYGKLSISINAFSPEERHDFAPTSDCPPDGKVKVLTGNSGDNDIVLYDETGIRVADFEPGPNIDSNGLNIDRSYEPGPPVTLETSVMVDVVESQTSVEFDGFFAQWGGLISTESASLRNLYTLGYNYDGNDIDDITFFRPGFDFQLGAPAVGLLSQESGPPVLSRLRVDVSRRVTESTLNIVQDAQTQFEFRLEHQPAGSDPPFLIQTQREVSNAITATTGNSPPAIPGSPVLESFQLLQLNGAPLTSLPSGGSIRVEAQVSNLFPVSGNPTEVGSVRFRVAGQDTALQDQGGGRFAATVPLGLIPVGILVPSVSAENLRFALPGNFSNSASASISRSEELPSQ